MPLAAIKVLEGLQIIKWGWKGHTVKIFKSVHWELYLFVMQTYTTNSTGELTNVIWLLLYWVVGKVMAYFLFFVAKMHYDFSDDPILTNSKHLYITLYPKPFTYELLITAPKSVHWLMWPFFMNIFQTCLHIVTEWILTITLEENPIHTWLNQTN